MQCCLCLGEDFLLKKADLLGEVLDLEVEAE